MILNGPQVFSVALFILINLGSLSLADHCPANVTNSARIDFLTDPCSYDKWSRPTDGDGPTKVNVRILVYFLGSIEAQNLQFTVHILLTYRWKDSRLMHEGDDIRGEAALRDKLWTPHLYLVNEHDSKVMGSSQADVTIYVGKDGTVNYATRLKATLLCLMNLQKFPFDNQQCPLILESWGYNTSQLILKWEENTPVTVKSETQLPEYSLMKVWTNSSVSAYPLGSEFHGDPNQPYNYQSKFAGNYSFLTVQFWLEREVGHYIMDYYVPSIFLVVVSWVSFWLDPNAVPGRTTLGTSTMLTFITLSRNIGSSLPKVSYVKATEIWFIVCTTFIFGSLVEFAFVNTIWRRRKNVELKKVSSKYILKSLTPQLKRKQMPNMDRSQSFTSLDDSKLSSSSYSPQKYNSQLTVMSIDTISKDPFPFSNASDTVNVSLPVPGPSQPQKGFFTMTPQEIACWIDKRSRIVFPVAFLIFNLFYWIFVWY